VLTNGLDMVSTAVDRIDDNLVGDDHKSSKTVNANAITTFASFLGMTAANDSQVALAA